jgi:transcriptional regulator with XRE-family HTH domain
MKNLNLKNIMEEKEILIRLGAQFKARRIEKKLNIKELGILSNLTRRTIYQIESGSSACVITTYMKLSKALDYKLLNDVT